MESKIDVFYCRFSSELQRTESIKDQERRCRDGLERLGIAHDHFIVIKDEAISGTQESRIRRNVAPRRTTACCTQRPSLAG